MMKLVLARPDWRVSHCSSLGPLPLTSETRNSLTFHEQSLTLPNRQRELAFVCQTNPSHFNLREHHSPYLALGLEPISNRQRSFSSAGRSGGWTSLARA